MTPIPLCVPRTALLIACVLLTPFCHGALKLDIYIVYNILSLNMSLIYITLALLTTYRLATKITFCRFHLFQEDLKYNCIMHRHHHPCNVQNSSFRL